MVAVALIAVFVVLVAVMVVVPALIAVIVPLLTDATLGLDDVHVTALLAPVGYGTVEHHECERGRRVSGQTLQLWEHGIKLWLLSGRSPLFTSPPTTIVRRSFQNLFAKLKL